LKKNITKFLSLLLLTAAVVPASAAGKSDIQPQLDQLAKGDWMQQAQALEQLAGAGSKSAVEPIDQLVKDQAANFYVRGRALVALAKLDSGKAAVDTQAFAASPDASLRAAAAEAYGYSSGNVAKAPLGNLLKDKDRKVAMAAIVSWARLYGKDAWAVVDPASKPLVNEKLPEDLRWKIVPAMHALAHTGTPDAHERINAITPLAPEPSLRGLVTSGEPSALPLAARYVHRVHNPGQKRTLGKGPSVSDVPEYRRVMEAVKSYGPEVVEATVRTLLQTKDPQDMVLACTMAAHMIPLPATGDMLLTACGDADNANVDHACVQALTVPAMQPERYLAYFAKLLKSKHVPSRRAGIDGLAACPEVNRFEGYSDIMQGGDSNEVLHVALEQLNSAPVEQAAGQKIETYLYKAMAANDPNVRKVATTLFRKVAAKRDYADVAKTWETLLHNKDWKVRDSARRAIATIATDDDLTELARSDGYITQWQVIGTFIGGETFWDIPAYPPEKEELDFSKTYNAERIFNLGSSKPFKRTRTIEWNKGTVTTVDGFLRVNYYVSRPTREAVAYAAATITPKTPGEAIIWVEGIATKGRTLPVLWVNGTLVLAPKPVQPRDLYLWPVHSPWRNKWIPCGGRATYKVTLKAGPNQILIKSLNIKQEMWDVRVRVLNLDGSPMEME